MTLAEAAEKSKIDSGTLSWRSRHGETGDYMFRLPKTKQLLRNGGD